MQPREQLQMFPTPPGFPPHPGLPPPRDGARLSPPPPPPPPPLGTQLPLLDHAVSPQTVGDRYQGICACGWMSALCATVRDVGELAGQHLRAARTVSA